MSTVPVGQKTAKKRGGKRLLLKGVRWESYRLLVRAFAESPGVRVTYDRGRLEVMSPLLCHDGDAYFLGSLIVVASEEFRMPIRGGGSTTLRRRSQLRGLEPDRCYWLANVRLVQGKRRLDLRVDPPPDLALEVDVTSSSLDRMSIYASLGVPEVWRLDEGSLSFHALSAGTYHPLAQSLSFPLLAAGDLAPFLALLSTEDDMEIRLRFRDWLRQRISQAAP